MRVRLGRTGRTGRILLVLTETELTGWSGRGREERTCSRQPLDL